VPVTDDAIKASLGATLRAERGRRSLTQERIAHAAGLSMNYISELERGKRNASVVTVFRLAEAMSVAPESLVRAMTKRLTKRK
jgi:transcriptional regulator with XRE-family HTH domain